MFRVTVLDDVGGVMDGLLSAIRAGGRGRGAVRSVRTAGWCDVRGRADATVARGMRKGRPVPPGSADTMDRKRTAVRYFET
ncbi:hypothetical protein GCM10018777_38470 [Streptomyces albogriseolus]|nr:hypothetical protein GCM10018777_38470 [Streptomyces viridodiastaticus]